MATVEHVRYQVTLLLFPKCSPGLAARCLLPMLKPNKLENLSCCGDIRQFSTVALYYSPRGYSPKTAKTVTSAEQTGKFKAMPLMLCACSFRSETSLVTTSGATGTLWLKVSMLRGLNSSCCFTCPSRPYPPLPENKKAMCLYTDTQMVSQGTS